MIKRLLILLALLIAVPCSGATYSFYFSDDATGNAAGTDTAVDITHCQGPAGTAGGTCKTLAHAQVMVDFADVADTVTLYFDRTDTWTYDSAQVSITEVYGIKVEADDPVVNIDAYGAGAKPKFDGLVGEAGYEDWADVPDHDATNGPKKWNKFFWFWKANCSVKNIEISRVYGNGIEFKNGGADSFTVSNCDINNFGNTGVDSNLGVGEGFVGENSVVEYCTIHTGQQLWLYEKMSGWGGAISFNGGELYQNNTVRYNIVYDIYGEGINLVSGTTEYNIVGDTYSSAIDLSTFDGLSGTNICRYNLIIHSDWETSVYDSVNSTGIRIYDERPGGDNSDGTFDIYGNIVINKNFGIWMFMAEDEGNQFALVKVYNNLIVDSHNSNIRLTDPEDFAAGYIYNNASILYHQTDATHVSDGDTLPHVNWTISNNAYWTDGGSPTVDANWQTNYIITDPLLPGEALAVNWDGQTGATYFSDIKYTTHLYPTAGALIQAGLDHAFEQTFLTTGTDFTNVLSGHSAFVRAEQHLTLPDIGPWARGAAEAVPLYPFQGAAGNFKYN